MPFGKNRQWSAILYNENMREDWKEEIDGLLQLPYVYCVHDKGLELEKGEKRKVHMHLILAFPGPTTAKHAIEVFDRLSAPGRKAFSTLEPVYSAQRMWDYLIHDTEDCRKKGKYLFDKSERITGNNYDIGAYVQVSTTEKNEIFDMLTGMILSRQISNFADFVEAALDLDPDRRELLVESVRTWSAYYERLIKGVYLRGEAEKQKQTETEKEIKKIVKSMNAS